MNYKYVDQDGKTQEFTAHNCEVDSMGNLIAEDEDGHVVMVLKPPFWNCLFGEPEKEAPLEDEVKDLERFLAAREPNTPAMAESHQVRPQYIFLENGEIVQRGDDWNVSNNIWVSAAPNQINKPTNADNTFRRRVN